jgi:hypothetical protein
VQIEQKKRGQALGGVGIPGEGTINRTCPPVSGIFTVSVHGFGTFFSNSLIFNDLFQLARKLQG